MAQVAMVGKASKKARRPEKATRKSVARLPVAEARLRTMILDQCEAFWEAVTFGNKSTIQAIHIASRDFETGPARRRAFQQFGKYKNFFLNGRDLEPEKIDPVLVLVEPRSDDEELFKIVRWTWSMPYSTGYGRRLRFLVWDRYHQAVMGIFGLQSPPADLTARDALFEYPKDGKLELINRTMDAYTIGAVPPYSSILGGKLIAGLVASNTVRQAYWRTYGNCKTLMEGKRIEQPLVAITTSSAFGRSSIYNRLSYNGRLLAEPIGYTNGTGSLHLENLYPYMFAVVKKHDGDVEAGGYGNGPKRKWQHMRRAMDIMDVPRSFFDHGLRRQVFLYRLTSDMESGMRGGKFGGVLDLKAKAFAQYWLQRWALPRSLRDCTWRTFIAEDYFRQAILHEESNG